MQLQHPYKYKKKMTQADAQCLLLNQKIFANEFISSFDNVLTDCDGVLWIGPNVLPGAPETLKYFQSLGKKVIYVTNNSSKSRNEYLTKLHALGFKAEKDDIFSTAHCAALYLKSLNFTRKVYAIGMSGVVGELQDMGIQTLPTGPDVIPEDWIPWIRSGIPMDPEVGAVVVGYDVHFSYPKMIRASTYLSSPDCLYISTNTDEQFPSEGNVILPGTGALECAVTCASRRKPIIIGKPFQYMFDCMKLVHTDLVPERCLMIGDRLSTDIVFGRRLSMQTLLVLTGISNLEDVRTATESTNEEKKLEIPHYYSPSLNDVAKLIELHEKN